MIEIAYTDLSLIFSVIRNSSFFAYKYGIFRNSLHKTQEISSLGINLLASLSIFSHLIVKDERIW